ncbi:MAG: hypothetical protein AcusKO_15910 [Acuticoccus sp.]
MTAEDYAARSIARGSASFAAAARLLPADVRGDAVRLYAWCRTCDDMIDGQVAGHGEARVDDGAARLAMLRQKTEAALSGDPTGVPEFDGLGALARRHDQRPPCRRSHPTGLRWTSPARATGALPTFAPIVTASPARWG